MNFVFCIIFLRSKTLKKYLIFVFIVLNLFINVFSQTLIEATAKVDKNKVSLGDVIRYTISVKRHGSVSQSPIVTPPSFDGFKVTGNYSSSNISIINNNATINVELVYDLLAVKSGEITIEPAQITFMNPLTKAQETIKTKPVTVYVDKGTKKLPPGLSVETPTPEPTFTPEAEEKDIREIKTKLEFRFSKILPFLILFIIFLIAILIAAYFIFKKPEPKKIIVEDTDYKKEALKKLIKARDILKKGNIKEYYYEVYEIIRNFLSGILKESFYELTTREIIKKLKEKKLLKDDKIKSINELLQELDLVKFTEYKPDDKETEAIEGKAQNIIENTI